MKRFLFTFLCLIVVSASFAQEGPLKPARRGEAAGYARRDATVLSVMGWGLALAVGIATLCALMDSSTTHAH